jgi:hypothetical protein
MSQKTLVLVAAMMAVAGCTLNRTELRRGASVLARLGGGGQTIQPKRCTLSVIILSRPLRDKVVNEAVWSQADEQAVAQDARRPLEANGVRIGVISGGLPAELESAINAPPPKKVDPAEFDMPDGDTTLVSLAPQVSLASLLLNRDGHAFGRDYQDASGWFRVTANHDGPRGLSLRFVPEIHHGPVLRRYDTAQNSNPLNSMQFLVKDGQQEETIRELAATLTLQPGQTAVIGCDPDRRGSLGSFLFTQAEANSDRIIQKLLIVRASRTNLGEPGSAPKPSSRLEPVEPPELPGLPAFSKDKDRDRNGVQAVGTPPDDRRPGA